MESWKHNLRKKRYKAERSKFVTMLHEESDEAVVPLTARTTQPCIGKGLCFNDTCVRR
jgi:hypothetical protein